MRVEADAEGIPLAVEDGARHLVELIRESWRVDDEWWRVSIARRYFDLILDGGRRVLLFHDLASDEWSVQRP